MRVWSGKIFRLLKCLAPFDCACVSLGTSSYLSSSAFSSCEDHVPISYVKHFWSRLWKEIIAKTTLQAVGMSKSSLMPLFPRYLSRQKQNIMWHLLFFVPTPVFLPNKQEKKTSRCPHPQVLIVPGSGPAPGSLPLFGHREHFSQLPLASCKWCCYLLCHAFSSLNRLHYSGICFL